MQRGTHFQPAQRQAFTDAALVALLGFAIIGGCLLAFLPALDAGLLNWDDDRNFLTNEAYRGLAPANLHWAWNTYHLGVWQPLAWVLLGMQHLIAGIDAFGHPRPRTYHATSIVLHTANALMVFALCSALLRAARREHFEAHRLAHRAAAGSAALLCAVHPLRTEAVVWISAQPYLPAIFLYLLALWLYVRSAARGRQGDPSLAALLAVFLCYVGGVLFKAVAVTLPIVLLLVDFYPLRRLRPVGGDGRRRLGRVVFEKLPFLVVALFIAKWAAEAKSVTQPGGEFGGLPFASRALQSLYGLGFYVQKTLMPSGLSPFYELPAGARTNPAVWLGLASGVGAALLVAGFFSIRRWPALSTVIFAYVVVLLPNLGIVQISQQSAADRYAYLATIPFAALLAGALARLWSADRIGTMPEHRMLGRMRGIGVVLFVAVASLSLIIGARHYTRDWQHSIALWRRAITVDPDSPHGHCNLGAALAAEGQFEQAAIHLRQAIDLRSDFSFAYANLGAVLLQLGDWSEAARCYQTALTVLHQMPREDQAKTHFGLSIALFESGDATGGWKHLHMASKLGYPRDAIEAAALRY